MKPLSRFRRLFENFCRRPGRPAAGFSLIEITLALGIVTFALVGVVGVLPLAMKSSRQSFDKNRAAAIAGTMFASFRSQPFQKVGYLDTQFDQYGVPLSGAAGLLDLNALNTTGTNPPNPEITLYATFLDGTSLVDTSSDPLGTQRHLKFATASSGGADYQVKIHFNNKPDGMVITPQPSNPPNGIPTVPAEANQVELVISPVNTPLDQYRFLSTIANRTN